MGKLFKYMIYLTIIGLICLILYTYIGPIFGVSLEPNRIIQRISVDLDES